MTTIRRAVVCWSVDGRGATFLLAVALPEFTTHRLPPLVWFMAILIRVLATKLRPAVYG
jgi:hypothetical protein